MDVTNQVRAIPEQLPQVRRITTLREVKHVKPPPVKKEPHLPRVSVKLFLIGLVFFSILGAELAIIYRYDKLNRRLYQISVSLKDKLAETRGELKRIDRVKYQAAKSRNSLHQAYRSQGSLYSKLQLKENSFKALLAAKTSWLGTVLGNLRVASAQVEALKAQRDLLAAQVDERGGQIRELRTQLLNNIGEQELLVNENIKLRQEQERLAGELTAINSERQSLSNRTEE